MKEERKPCLHAHVKWFYGQSERAYYLNYFIIARSSPIISFNLSIEKSHAFVNQPPLSSKKQENEKWKNFMVVPALLKPVIETALTSRAGGFQRKQSMLKL